MRPHLLEVGDQPAAGARLPVSAPDLIRDLELDVLLGAMGGGDPFLRDVAQRVLLVSLHDADTIRYRQRVLADCLERRAVIRQLYAIADAAIVGEARVWGAFLDQYPESVLARATKVLELFVDLLRRLRQVADAEARTFRSEGFGTLFAMLAREVDEPYLRTVDDHLERLRFRAGLVMTARLGNGNRGTDYVLRRPAAARPGWRQRVPALDRSGLTYQIPDRSEEQARALADLKGRGIGLAAAALAQSTEQILEFFRLLRTELGFYVACLNLVERLEALAQPVCMPEPGTAAPRLSAQGLYDVSLCLTLGGKVIGNDLAADGRSLVVITGANRGGKSTLLRSLGQAQLMLQCGMFVPAQSFTADLHDGIFTHFKREEDAELRSGKLDEELRRMGAIIDGLTPDGLVLLNESFASTNEREGSEIARQIIGAMVESGVKVIAVTHLYDLANGLYRAGGSNALFLRAERRPDGERTFRVLEGAPLPTSFGADVYRRVFGTGPGGSGIGPGGADTGPGAPRRPD